MSWSDLKELILQERQFLERGGMIEFLQESAFETQHSALLACYLRTKAHVDAIVSRFAQTLEWPEMSSVEKFFVAARLDFAWEIASILSTDHNQGRFIAFPCPETGKTAQLLEWLLVDIWPYGCGRFLQNQKCLAEQAPSMQRHELPVPAEAPKIECVA